MKRTNTRIGDVFSVKLNSNSKKYFQYIANDLTQLNSDVIRGFKKEYLIDENPELSEILEDEVDFYAHCVTKLGIKMDLWEKVGNMSEIGNVTNILFKGASDYARKAGEEPIKISERWYVWKINDRDFKEIGKLQGEYKKAYVGLVINPNGIIELLKGNKYPTNYPN
jgi:hypothetical protein